MKQLIERLHWAGLKISISFLAVHFILFIPALTVEPDAYAEAQSNSAKSPVGCQKDLWYVPRWLATDNYAPVFEVKDTLHKYGRYAVQTKKITVKDLIKFHGHLCGGLVEAACAMRVALDSLFADGIIDRTDLRFVSNNSACGADVAQYVTGARARFGSHGIDKKLKGGEFIVERISTGQTVRVWRNPDIYPTEVKAQMKKIESGTFLPKDTDLFGRLQWDYAERLINRPLKESFRVESIKDYQWPEPACNDLGERTDNKYRNTP